MPRPSKKEEIYSFVENKYKKEGFPPTLGEIADHLGLAAKSNIHRQLQKLVSEGRLRNLGGRYVPSCFNNADTAEVVLVPVIGKVAAGQPISAFEENNGYVAYLPRFGDGDGSDLFALRIKGDSMKNAGIFSGDVVIVKKTPVAEDGDIAVALVGDEATVKTFYHENDHFRLQPENPDYDPIILDEVAILGRVIASIKYIGNRGRLK